MNTVDAWFFVLLQEVSSGNVSRQHALLNQLVRVVALDRRDSFYLAIFAEDDARLGGIEVDRSAAITSRAQTMIEAIECLNRFYHIGILLAQRFTLVRIGLSQHARHFGVGEACLGVNYTLIELVVPQRTVALDRHLTDHRETVDFRI